MKVGLLLYGADARISSEAEGMPAQGAKKEWRMLRKSLGLALGGVLTVAFLTVALQPSYAGGFAQ